MSFDDSLLSSDVLLILSSDDQPLPSLLRLDDMRKSEVIFPLFSASEGITISDSSPSDVPIRISGVCQGEIVAMTDTIERKLEMKCRYHVFGDRLSCCCRCCVVNRAITICLAVYTCWWREVCR